MLKELKMKKQSMLRLSVILLATVGAISTASAQTNAQQAQGQSAATAGVTQVAQVQRPAVGVNHIGAATATPEVAHIQNGQTNPGATQQPCVGPASFCTLYFGS
ncbi:hypothetical protein L5014_30720 [Paraburkholderia sp. RG36]|uniref:Uncharacterized protein n=2 Tax=Paraburkholderia tagetis TaxID=2913261 RepID=A0A9X1ULN6_9BURK|nr:hypothetical protein [Paraburkholderia tagetis]